jgi:hypothetical protein
MVFTSFAFDEVDLAQAQALEDIVFDGYLEGLHDAGWRGAPQQIRLGYTAGHVRLRLGELDRVINFLLDESQHPFAEQAFGRSIEEIEDHFGRVGRWCDDRLDEARGLMAILN